MEYQVFGECLYVSTLLCETQIEMGCNKLVMIVQGRDIDFQAGLMYKCVEIALRGTHLLLDRVNKSGRVLKVETE